MRKILEDYLNWSSQLKRALTAEVLNPASLDVGSLSGIAFVGMGGSGIIGDIVAKYLEREVATPVVVVKSFALPKYVDSKWLVVAVSYSGNTLETLTVFSEAARRRVKLAAVSSGGRLMELAEKLGVSRIYVESGYLPRVALPSMLAKTVVLLNKLTNLKIDIERGVEILKDVEGPEAARELANFLSGGLPVFVVTENMYPLGIRAKNEMNENAKIACKVEVLPEWGHNDVVGWESTPRDLVKIVVLRDGFTELADFAAEYLRKLNYSLKVLEVGRVGYFETVLYGSWVIGLASVLLASIRGVNSESTESIEHYKQFIHSYLKFYI
ncbi:MAG: bifunctional phosphoglucose/phosphomannose isomerase [Sulfolobales archaeon]|nr:bifunctional phosphoglucose/phosphomannose isomerase [Sulfolobales archaeon]MDW8082515.1 bifunctional phosphoglucose/phosphomannose isomerase [Sulfolobales archaeon]